MASCLSTWPFVLFGIVEPLLLVWGYINFLQDPFQYYAAQMPGYPSAIEHFTPPAQVLSWQMGNIFPLLAAIAVICCWTKHGEVAVWYLIAVAFADMGHIYAVYRAGPDYFLNVAEWNDMTWGNVGVSAFLNVNRWLTVLGVFGTVGGSMDRAKKTA
ncbi:hypothetical protein FZEAL_9823 [Fusarium zealandicum]|uniref:DUF7704 domain-containing protein n=1 Tax=Fusarium zealandicum TaxID=1053134 RepID=A0A8H4XEU5_9HYPO|nr:hypothetical protein FZEAL_9823 [Fusarium zealandicum]